MNIKASSSFQTSPKLVYIKWATDDVRQGRYAALATLKGLL